MTKLTPKQYAFLIDQIQDSRVRQLRGNSHLEAWDIRRNLIRAFGFGGFDVETKALDLVAQIEHPPAQQGGKSRWTVVYRAEIRLTVKAADGSTIAVLEDGAAGDSQNQPSLGDAHDQAMKTALSQGLKRCAVNLGDQFGLSLYNGGKTNRVVVRSLVHPEQPEAPVDPGLPKDDSPVLPEPGTEPAVDEHHQELAQPARPVSGPPANRPTSGAPRGYAVGEVPVPDALGAAATSILDDLAQAYDETAMRRVWKLAGEATSEGRISLAESDYVRDRWTVRKEQLFPTKPATPAQHRHIHALCKDAGLDDRDTRLLFLSEFAGWEIDTQNRLSVDQAKAAIERLQALAAQSTPPAEQEGQAA
ncbi:Rad52/Rad22 family DNA repair protein [Micromonospora echinospora]